MALAFSSSVIPAQAGIQRTTGARSTVWVPAFAGMMMGS